jgi:[protein-PII] uridylyltransferase
MESQFTPSAPYFDSHAMREELAALWRSHSGSEAEIRRQLLLRLKAVVKAAREQALNGLEADGSGRRCSEGLALFQDELIRLLYDFATHNIYRAQNPSAAERMAIVATGGYGRAMMAPGSDVDLLFLLPYKQTAWGESVAEYVLYFLWDLGFKVGHATRTVEQCIKHSRADMTICTALLDARLVIGDGELFRTLQARFLADVVPWAQKQFITAKLKERDDRHDRTGLSRYAVEPNIKDGKGGLRDLHMLYWLTKYLYPERAGMTFTGSGVFSPAERRAFRRCEDFLWTVRCHLHFLAGKAEERLTFDVQTLMSQRLGYRDRPGMRAVERFMKHYFLVAKEVGDLTRVLCSALEVKQLKATPTLTETITGALSWRTRAKLSATSDFRIENGRITVHDRKAFQIDPLNMLRLFALAEKYNVEFHPEAIRLVRASLRLIDDKVRADPEANRIFLELLTSKANAEVTLRRMNEAGLLGRFIPEFGRVVSMMQFNMYHHYTVDEHLIRAVGILSDIERGAVSDELPLATDIIMGLEHRRALYVATFLHDVAKGREEDHSIAGERMARSLGPRLGLTPEETETAAWLVKNHLVMSLFAQSRDLNDAKTICDFAAIVQNVERMKLLVILTAADIRAVGPGVWSGWKGQLLRSLYYETEPVLSGGYTRAARETRIREAQNAFRERMKAWPQAEADAFIEQQYNSYWLRTELDRQVAHAELIRKSAESGPPLAVEISTSAFTDATEMMIVCRDRPRLVAMSAGACAAAGANIVGAQLLTTKDGMSLNTYSLHRAFDDDKEEVERVGRIASVIGELVRGDRSLEQVMSRTLRPKSRLEAFSVLPLVLIDNTVSDDLTVIEVTGLDRPGLLYDVANAMSGLGLDISSAHVATFGEKAIDVFYVRDLARKKIVGGAEHKKIRQRLLEVLGSTPGA